MTATKKLIIISILIVVIVSVLRETGIISVEYYKVTSETTLGNSWKNRSMTATIDSSIMHTKFANGQFNELSVVVLYSSDTLFKDDNIKNNAIIVTIDTLKYGSLWTPLYKSSKFTVTGTAVYKNELIKTPSNKISLVKADLVGQLNINGSILIAGICSHRQAVKLVKQLAVNSFVAETRKYFSTLD